MQTTEKQSHPRRHARLGNFALAAVALSCCFFTAACRSPRPERNLSAKRLAVLRVEALGTFHTNAFQYGRDAGNSSRIGSRIIWVFGDTITLSGFPSSTAAWSSPERPLELSERVDAKKAPMQFFPFSPEELEFENAHATPPECCTNVTDCPAERLYCHCPADTDCAVRIALWPGDVIETGPTSGAVLYEKLVVGAAPYDFRHLGTGLARVKEGDAVAVRVTDESGLPALVFKHPEPNFLRAVAVPEADGAFVYVYAAVGDQVCLSDLLIGRVPLERMGERGAYTFWDGSAWVSDLGAAAPILGGVPEKLGSVVWNDYFGRYLSGFTSLCTGGSKFHFRTAPRPEGPWSEPVILDLAPIGTPSDAYAGLLHPALGRGRQMTISYYHPLPEIVGEIRLARVTFE